MGYSCSSCANWGCDQDFGLTRKCSVSGFRKSADCAACMSFRRSLCTMTVEEAVRQELIPKPIKC